MKKKGKTIKKKPLKSSKINVKKTVHKPVQKVMVGEDEFCPTCMEWRPFDETTGRCRICGCRIKKKDTRSRIINEEYDLKDFTVEHDEQQDAGED